jgi:hypothetical protein
VDVQIISSVMLWKTKSRDTAWAIHVQNLKSMEKEVEAYMAKSFQPFLLSLVSKARAATAHTGSLRALFVCHELKEVKHNPCTN